MSAKSITGLSAILIVAAIISECHETLSAQSPEQEPRFAGETGESGMRAYVTQIDNPSSGLSERGLQFVTEYPNANSSDQEVGYVTITNQAGTPLFLLVDTKGTSIDPLCQANGFNNPLGLQNVDQTACMAQSDFKQVHTFSVDNQSAPVPIYLTGGQRLIPLWQNNENQLQFGTSVVDKSTFQQAISTLLVDAGNSVDVHEQKVIIDDVTVRSFMPAPTESPTSTPAHAEGSPVTSPQQEATPTLELWSLVRQPASEVTSVVATIRGGETVVMYQLLPGAEHAGFIRMSEMEGVPLDEYLRVKGIIEKEIALLEGWSLFNKPPSNIERVTLPEGMEQTYGVAYQDSGLNSNVNLLYDNEGRYYYFRVDPKNAENVTYYAADSSNVVDPAATQILNTLHREQYIDHSWLQGPRDEKRRGYIIDPELQASFISQLGSYGKNQNLFNIAVTTGKPFVARALSADGTMQVISVPSGIRYTTSDADSYVWHWDTVQYPAPNAGETINEKRIIYAQVDIPLIFGGEDFDSNITHETLQAFITEAQRISGSSEKITILVPLNAIVPEELFNKDQPQSSNNNTISFAPSSPPVYGTQLNQLVAELPMTASTSNRDTNIINSKAWSMMQRQRAQAMRHRV